MPHVLLRQIGHFRDSLYQGFQPTFPTHVLADGLQESGEGTGSVLKHERIAC